MTMIDGAHTRNGAADSTATGHQYEASVPVTTPHPPAPEPAPVTDTAATGPAPAAADRGDDARRHALWFFWMWLLFATVVSIGGNVIHAWMTAPADHLKLLAAVAAAVPPAVLLGSTHSVALLIRTRQRGYRRVDAFVLAGALTLTVGVAVCAFAMSFFSLRDLIILLGMSRDIAWLWPIAVDLSLICSTLALLSLTPPPAPDARAAEGMRRQLVVAPAPATPHVATVTGPSSPAERRLWWESIAAVVRERNQDARKLAEMSNGQLAGVLERMYDRNESGRVITDTTNLHHREVKAIRETTDDVLARPLLAGATQ